MAMDAHYNKSMNNKQLSLGRFAWQVVKGRWMVVVLSLYILSFSGATYIFAIYSGAIKSALNYNQQTVDTLSFFKDLGANVGIIAGLINEVAPPWVVLAIGACMNVFGYLMLWLATTHRISPPSSGNMYLYICLGANSQTFANTGVLVTCVKNFPQSRGVVLGLVKGCVGLSGAIFTQIYHAIYGQDSSGIILLIALLPTAINLLFMFLIRPTQPVMNKSHDKHFFSFLYIALLLAAFLMVMIIIENVFPVSSAVYKAMAAVTLLLVAANVLVAVQAEAQDQSSCLLYMKDATNKLPPAMATTSTAPPADPQQRAHLVSLVNKVDAESEDEDEEKQEATANNTDGTLHSGSVQMKLVEASQQSGGSSCGVQDQAAATRQLKKKGHRPMPLRLADLTTRRKFHDAGQCLKQRLSSYFDSRNWPERGDDFTIPQAILSLDMWILFVSFTCGVGATLTAIDNLGQIGESLGYSSVSISTCVSLISIWNFLGRVIAGFLSEYLLHRYRFPRTLALTIVMALACVGHVLIAFPAPGTLYVASVMVGLCFGAHWPLMYAIVSELFGLKYYATLYNVGGVASPLGSYLLNVKVAGYLYDKEARRQSLSGSVCNGAECFRLTFIIMTLVSAAGSIISILLVMRTRRFYGQEDIYAKFSAAAVALNSSSTTVSPPPPTADRDYNDDGDDDRR